MIDWLSSQRVLQALSILEERRAGKRAAAAPAGRLRGSGRVREDRHDHS